MKFEEIIKTIRKEIREAYKGETRVSVRENQGGYSYSMTITIENGEFDKAREIVAKYQDAGETDIMTDYFDYNFYVHYSTYFGN